MGCSFKWSVVPALIIIARNVKRSGAVVTAGQLSAWAESEEFIFTLGNAEMSLRTLAEHKWCKLTTLRRHQKTWQITPEGMHAARAALQTLPGTPGPDVKELSTRLWNLLRIRHRLTAEEAAETLVDADCNFAAEKKRIGAVFAAWAKFAPHCVTTALKRESGRVRYVLTEDLGRWPPPSKPGQMHPTAFACRQAVPAIYRKPTPAKAAMGGALE